MTDYIALVRCSPSSTPAATLRAAIAGAPGRDGRGMVFLHGEGVAFAASNEFTTPGCELHVCSTSWRRRFDAPRPASPYLESSLAGLFGALSGASRVDSFGVAGHCCSIAAADGDVLFEIASAPASDEQATETLELVLGAAAMEMPFAVLFSGSGAVHLAGSSARGWRQLTDFGLAEVFAAGPDSAAPGDGPACVLDRAGAMRLRGDARTIVLA